MIGTDAPPLVIEPLALPFGAVIRGLRFTAVTSPSTVVEVEQAIAQYPVLVFRGHEPPTDAQLAEFTSHFGVRNPKDSRQIEFTKDGYPEIVILSNVPEDGKPVGSAGEAFLDWHADLAHSRHNARFGFLMPWRCRTRAEIHSLRTATLPWKP